MEPYFKALRAFVMLFIFGAMIGYLHQQDVLVAAILAATTVLMYGLTYRQKPSAQRGYILLAGALVTGVGGVMAEWWGIHYGYWAYHDLPDGRHFAMWLPFAWMAAFTFLYRLEAYFINFFNLTRLKDKLILAATIAIIFPTWGEIVAIYFGVWSYSWDYQILGVPLLAIALLMVFHTLIFLIFTLYCKKHQIYDDVFNRASSSVD